MKSSGEHLGNKSPAPGRLFEVLTAGEGVRVDLPCRSHGSIQDRQADPGDAGTACCVSSRLDPQEETFRGVEENQDRGSRRRPGSTQNLAERRWMNSDCPPCADHGPHSRRTAGATLDGALTGLWKGSNPDLVAVRRESPYPNPKTLLRRFQGTLKPNLLAIYATTMTTVNPKAMRPTHS